MERIGQIKTKVRICTNKQLDVWAQWFADIINVFDNVSNVFAYMLRSNWKASV